MTSIWDEIVEQSKQETSKQEKCGFKAGNTCPKCKKAKLEYNGTLSLVCPHCGLEISGGFT